MKSSGSRLAPRLVLDSSAYSHLRGDDERVIEHLAAAEVILVPAIVVGELEAAFAAGTRSRENLQRLDEFLAEVGVEVVPMDREVARRYGQVFASLRRAGTPISVNDIWIAATALATGAHLLTFDADFRRVAGLDCSVLKPRP